jgi:hypothetical protein
MSTALDPEVIRSLDPRRSYLPKPQPTIEAVAETEARSPDSLASLSIEDLRREIERRQKATGHLRARREKLVAELAEIDAQLRAVGALHNVAAPAAKPTRPRQAASAPKTRATNTVSLADALAMAVEPRAVVSPAEATDLVKANGYVSTAKNMGMIVANALAKDARFKRVGRGQYERVG